jgi:hypothetical protein
MQVKYLVSDVGIPAERMAEIVKQVLLSVSVR